MIENKWVWKEIEFLKDNYGRISVERLARTLNRSKEGIYHKARRLGIRWTYKSWKDKSNYRLKNKSAIVNYFDILNTYGHDLKDLAYKYMKSRDLRNNGVRLNKINDIVRVPEGTIVRWCYGKGKPESLRCLEKLHGLGLIPLTTKDCKKFRLILKLFAYMFTDGSLNKKLSSIAICGEAEDLTELKKEIENCFNGLLRCNISTSYTHGVIEEREIKGISSVLRINSTALSRVLYSMGAPAGDKVIQVLSIPRWVFKLTDPLKQIFLGVIWTAEGSKPLFNKNSFNLYFGMAKDVKLILEHKRFLDQIRELFEEAGIETSGLKEDKKCTKRKDGRISCRLYFYIRSNHRNFLKFYYKIPIFSIAKKKAFDKANTYCLSIFDKAIRKRLRIGNTLKIVDFLLNRGSSINSISKKLELPRSTIRYWLNEMK